MVPHSAFDTARVVAEVLDFPWEDVVTVWGKTASGIAWSSIQAGSQTTHAHTRANYAAGMAGRRLLQELAAAEMGGNPDGYRVGGRGVAGPGGRLTWAQAAERAIKRGGKFDGHEVAADLNAMTKTGAATLAGQGFVAAARDTYPRDGQTFGFVAGFAEVEVDVETGVYKIIDYVAVGDVGTVINPRSLSGQILGGGIQGMSHTMSQKLVYDTQYGVAIGKRMYRTSRRRCWTFQSTRARRRSTFLIPETRWLAPRASASRASASVDRRCSAPSPTRSATTTS